MVQADFGFRAGFDPESRLFDPALGGGALLDVGVYCLSFASMLLGTPERSHRHGGPGLRPAWTSNAAMLLRYPNGAIAVLSTAIRTANTPSEAIVIGTEGTIHIHAPFWIPTALTLSRSGKDDEMIELPYEGNGYKYEAQEVARCVGARPDGERHHAARRDPGDHEDDGHPPRPMGRQVPDGVSLMHFGNVPGVAKPISRLVQAPRPFFSPELLDLAMEHGFNTFDTGHCYGENTSVVFGQWMRDRGNPRSGRHTGQRRAPLRAQPRDPGGHHERPA